MLKAKVREVSLTIYNNNAYTFLLQEKYRHIFYSNTAT